MTMIYSYYMCVYMKYVYINKEWRQKTGLDNILNLI